VAGHESSASTTFTVNVTFASLEALVARFCADPEVTAGLTDKLRAAAAASTPTVRRSQLAAFERHVAAQTGKSLTREEAEILVTLARALR
jgi:hypothetical protein